MTNSEQESDPTHPRTERNRRTVIMAFAPHINSSLQNHSFHFRWRPPPTSVYPNQRDQIKVAKCLFKLPKNDSTWKKKDFENLYKNCLKMCMIWAIYCCHRLWKGAQSATNHLIWSHWPQHPTPALGLSRRVVILLSSCLCSRRVRLDCLS